MIFAEALLLPESRLQAAGTRLEKFSEISGGEQMLSVKTPGSANPGNPVHREGIKAPWDLTPGEERTQNRPGSSGAAIGVARDPKFAREFAQAVVGGASGAMI